MSGLCGAAGPNGPPQGLQQLSLGRVSGHTLCSERPEERTISISYLDIIITIFGYDHI